jgi:hypothetical protein
MKIFMGTLYLYYVGHCPAVKMVCIRAAPQTADTVQCNTGVMN